MPEGLPARSARALDLVGEVIKVDDTVYLVESQTDSGKWYHVGLLELEYRCTCPDFEHRGVVCKHARAVALAEARGELKTVDTIS